MGGECETSCLWLYDAYSVQPFMIAINGEQEGRETNGFVSYIFNCAAVGLFWGFGEIFSVAFGVL